MGKSPYLGEFERVGSDFGCGGRSQGIRHWGEVNWLRLRGKAGRQRGAPCTRHGLWALDLGELVGGFKCAFSSM